jgi:hypothetical protein
MAFSCISFALKTPYEASSTVAPLKLAQGENEEALCYARTVTSAGITFSNFTLTSPILGLSVFFHEAVDLDANRILLG